MSLKHSRIPLLVTAHPAPACRVLGCNESVVDILNAADANGDSNIDEAEFRAFAALLQP